jgi:hypothetical protein
MGEVYRARDTRLARDVAVKILPPAFTNDAYRVSRFEREARAVASLAHPAILVLHDVGTANDVRYVVTELLEGQTLRERLEQNPLPWRRAGEIGASIAEGLAAAHGKSIVHRRCLEKDRAARFQTATDLVFALRAMLADTEAAQQWTTTHLAPPRPLHRRRLVAAGVAIAAVAAAATYFAFAGPTGPPMLESIAVLPLTDLSNDANTAFRAIGVLPPARQRLLMNLSGLARRPTAAIAD